MHSGLGALPDLDTPEALRPRPEAGGRGEGAPGPDRRGVTVPRVPSRVSGGPRDRDLNPWDWCVRLLCPSPM